MDYAATAETTEGLDAALTLRKHLVQSFRRIEVTPVPTVAVGEGGIDIRWECRLGLRIRWVRFLACDTLCPTSLFFPHRSQAFAIG